MEERRGFFDKLYISGKEALKPSNIILAIVLHIIGGIILGIEGIIKNLNQFGFWEGLYFTWYDGLGRAFTAIWIGLNNLSEVQALQGTRWMLIFFAVFLLISVFPIVKIFLDIIDLKKGAAFGFFVTLFVTIIVIISLSYLVHENYDFTIDLDIENQEKKTAEPDPEPVKKEDEPIKNVIDMSGDGG